MSNVKPVWKGVASEIVKDFKCQKKEFVSYPKGNGEPLKLVEQRSDMVAQKWRDLSLARRDCGLSLCACGSLYMPEAPEHSYRQGRR